MAARGWFLVASRCQHLLLTSFPNSLYPWKVSAEETAKRLVVNWLRANITGCMFATKFASAGGAGTIRPHVIIGSLEATHLAEQLEPLLNDAATHAEAVLLIFPDLRTPADVARLLRALGNYPTWSVSRTSRKEHERADLLVSLEWNTPTGNVTAAMGMAPLGSMPITRRAPYVCIVLWPGGHENPFRQSDRKRVSLADMKHGLDEYTHEKFWTQSTSNKSAYLEGQNEGAAMLRVSFCLDPAVREILFPTLSASA